MPKHSKKKFIGLQGVLHVPTQGGYFAFIPPLPFTGNEELDRAIMFVGLFLTGLGIAKQQKWIKFPKLWKKISLAFN